MEDTLEIGDAIIALNYWYGIKMPFTDYQILSGREPQRGDILFFRNPRIPSEIFLKRCIAVGGQTVEIQAKEVFVDGVEIPLPPQGKHADHSIFPKGTSDRDFMRRITLPDSTIFVLGDNRDFSGDSREYGPIPKKNLTGKAWIIAWSLAPGVQWKNIEQKMRKERFFVPVK